MQTAYRMTKNRQPLGVQNKLPANVQNGVAPKKETSNLASDSKLSLNPGRFLVSGAEINQTDASNTITRNYPKIKSLEDLFRSELFQRLRNAWAVNQERQNALLINDSKQRRAAQYSVCKSKF